MAQKITDLHLQGDDETIVRPNIVRENIPSGAINKAKLDADVQASLAKADTAMQGIGDGSITKAKLDADVRQSLAKADTAMQSIDDGSITKAKLASGVQQSLEKADSAMQGIADGSVTKAKLASGVQQSLDKADTAMQEIPSNSVGTDELKPESVTAGKLAANSVINQKISDGVVTNSKIADNTIESEKIKDNAITTDKINNGSVTWDKLNSGVKNAITNADTVGVIELNNSNTSGTLTAEQLALLSKKNVIIKYGTRLLQRSISGPSDDEFELNEVDYTNRYLYRHYIDVVKSSGNWTYVMNSVKIDDEVGIIELDDSQTSGTLTAQQIAQLSKKIVFIEHSGIYYEINIEQGASIASCDKSVVADDYSFTYYFINIDLSNYNWYINLAFGDVQPRLTTSDIADGTIVKNIGFNSDGLLVKQAPSGGGSEPLYCYTFQMNWTENTKTAKLLFTVTSKVNITGLVDGLNENKTFAQCQDWCKTTLGLTCVAATGGYRRSTSIDVNSIIVSVTFVGSNIYVGAYGDNASEQNVTLSSATCYVWKKTWN